MFKAQKVTTVRVSAIAVQCADFRAVALSEDETTMFMYIEDGPLGRHWYWWRRGKPGTMLEDFKRKSSKYPKVITGKFTILADK